MKFRILFILIILFAIYFITFTAYADPQVSFTMMPYGMKTVLTPNLNSDVTHYKWSIIGKKNDYTSDTGWIAYEDRGDHIMMLDNGVYFITITGRNISIGLINSFTSEIKVSIEESYIEPSEEEVIEEEIGNRIINSLPEPFKSFLSERNKLELSIIILGSLLMLFIVTKRKKIKKYVKLERYND